jgi:hypothetical protein
MLVSNTVHDIFKLSLSHMIVCVPGKFANQFARGYYAKNCLNKLSLLARLPTTRAIQHNYTLEIYFYYSRKSLLESKSVFRYVYFLRLHSRVHELRENIITKRGLKIKNSKSEE